MAGLGQTLRDARLALGYSIEDVERETRIASRYIVALEEDDDDALPAPVYARGFLRTYARYLGLDPDQLLASQNPPVWEPSAGLVPAREESAAPIRTSRWAIRVVGVLVAAVLLVAIVVGLTSLRGDGGPALPAAGQQAAGTAEADQPGGRVLPVPAPTGEVRPRTVDAPAISATDGSELPDFRGRELQSALDTLTQLGVPYLVAHVHSDKVPAGNVLQQTPRPGAKIDAKTSVTLVASLGPASAASPSPAPLPSATQSPAPTP